MLLHIIVIRESNKGAESSGKRFDQRPGLKDQFSA
jgi:hypothetical protein